MASQLLSRCAPTVALICSCAAWQLACSEARDQTKPAAEKPQQVHCEDFITTADVSALGLKAEPYKEVLDQRTQAARCSFGDMSAVIWRGDKFGNLVEGVKEHGKKAGIVTEDGPPVGLETHWTKRPGTPETGGGERYTLNFVPQNRKFTASVTGTDKSQVEQLATTLLDKFQRM